MSKAQAHSAQAVVTTGGGLKALWSVENHPNDSRVKITGNTVQTLSSRMGTGGGNVPLILGEYDE